MNSQHARPPAKVGRMGMKQMEWGRVIQPFSDGAFRFIEVQVLLANGTAYLVPSVALTTASIPYALLAKELKSCLSVVLRSGASGARCCEYHARVGAAVGGVQKSSSGIGMLFESVVEEGRKRVRRSRGDPTIRGRIQLCCS